VRPVYSLYYSHATKVQKHNAVRAGFSRGASCQMHFGLAHTSLAPRCEHRTEGALLARRLRPGMSSDAVQLKPRAGMISAAISAAYTKIALHRTAD